MSAAVTIKRSFAGMGVFANRDFYPTETLGEILGEVIDDPEYTSRYCMSLTDDSVIEPAAPYRFANHSCDPNCELTTFDDCPGQLFMVACKPIWKGDEITIDYGWPAEDDSIRCLCGSPNCRGWVVDAEEVELLETG